uniref:DDE Tnp4 domain-containing protein n=1 Tax=Chenopodium quinoa TaxID=63459 RepID=A0A803L6A5_CHEQI
MLVRWTGLAFDAVTGCPLIKQDDRWAAFVKDCVGALDGTHISAVVSDGDGQPFRGRKGTKTWNVLASCSFNRLFTFVNVGYQGSAHDIMVTDPKFEFPHPPLGYPNTLGYLSPIKDKQTSYHMPEFHNGPPPRGMLEHYNYRHSSLRTTIERCFGNVKGQWKILKNMPQMSQTYQLSIILSTFTLHNFIRLYTLGIPISERCANVEPRVEYSIFDEDRKAQMDIVQNQIAEHIWQSVRDIEEEDHHIDVE